MNRSFEIVTDSCCNLTEETIDRYELHVLPLSFMADGDDTVYRSYLKGRKTDLSQFYTMMREGKVFRTSLPNLADTETLFRSLLDQGRDILYLGFSSGLSGTYEATELLAKQLREEYPQRKLLTVDTLSASGGQGLLVWHACQRAEQGADIEEVRDWTEANKLHLAHWFTVDDLMFLWRGGRVSKTSAWAGTLLNIKPVMHVDDEGHLVPLERCADARNRCPHCSTTWSAPARRRSPSKRSSSPMAIASMMRNGSRRRSANVSASKTSASTTSTPSSERIPARAPWRCSSWHRTAIRNPSDTKACPRSIRLLRANRNPKRRHRLA